MATGYSPLALASNFDITHDRTEAYVKLIFLAVFCAFFLMAGMASAQTKGDLGLGFGTLLSTPSWQATGITRRSRWEAASFRPSVSIFCCAIPRVQR